MSVLLYFVTVFLYELDLKALHVNPNDNKIPITRNINACKLFCVYCTCSVHILFIFFFTHRFIRKYYCVVKNCWQ